MKLVVSLILAIACLHAAPALAQGQSGPGDIRQLAEPDTKILGFIRIPLSEERQRRPDPVIGFGLFTDCSRTANWRSSAEASACDAQPIRSLEFAREFDQRDWLLSFTSNTHWVGVARLYPDGFGSVREYGPLLSNPDQNFGVN